MKFVIVKREDGEERPGFIRSGDTVRGKHLVVYIGNFEREPVEWVPFSRVTITDELGLYDWYEKNVEEV